MRVRLLRVVKVQQKKNMLVDAEDAEGLANTIKEFVFLPDEKRKEIGKRGRVVIETEFNLTYEKTTTRITFPVAAPFMDFGCLCLGGHAYSQIKC